MIVDVRTYSFRPGTMADWVALYEKEAWPIQQKHLGTCLGWYTSVEGKLNQVVHIWQYESQADREARRAAMAQDPAWKAFQAKAKELGAFTAQENSILVPAPFFKQG
jgi:NIPSNAP